MDFQDYRILSRLQGFLLTIFLSGQLTKDDYLRASRQLDRPLQKITTYYSSADELETELSLITNNPEFAASEKKSALLIASLIQAFQPSEEAAPHVLFFIIRDELFEVGVIPVSPGDYAACQDTGALFANWSTTTLRLFFDYMRHITTELEETSPLNYLTLGL